MTQMPSFLPSLPQRSRRRSCVPQWCVFVSLEPKVEKGLQTLDSRKYTASSATPQVYRDSFCNWLLGRPEFSDAELAHQRRKWAASTAMSMYIEVVAIITCRILYLAFRQHRFVINFGYGFDSSDGESRAKREKQTIWHFSARHSQRHRSRAPVGTFLPARVGQTT